MESSDPVKESLMTLSSEINQLKQYCEDTERKNKKIRDVGDKMVKDIEKGLSSYKKKTDEIDKLLKQE